MREQRTPEQVTGPPGSRLLEQYEVKNRRGTVRVWSFKPNSDRQRHYTHYVMLGHVEAVMVEVARRLEGCTQCYEHMFRVDSVTPVDMWLLRVACTANSYAGD